MHEPKHAVVLATSGHRRPLLIRALSSLAQQATTPDRVVLVEDGEYQDPPSIEQLAARQGIAAEVLANRRTKGASGAWNSALDHLTRTIKHPEAWLVSVLDDDDWWDLEYLTHVRHAAKNGASVVAGTIRRLDADHPDGCKHGPPTELVMDDFLVGNPGLQGSNLTARLATFLEAGLFDEALASGTDRDIALRFIQIDAVYQSAPAALVHHDANHECDRLSDPLSESKQRGLAAFFAKWRRYMTSQQADAFTERARRLFDWEPTPAASTDHHESASAAEWPLQSGSGKPLDLVVGTVVSGDNIARAQPLIDDLARLANHERVTQLDVVLLQNGNAQGFQELVTYGANRGLTVWPGHLADQTAALDDVSLHPGDVTPHKPIAVARTLLQRFVYTIVGYRNHPPAWILDDDYRLPEATDELVDRLIACRDSDADVVIGGNRGAPPVPAHAVLRTQLLDIVHFLSAACRRNLDEWLNREDPIIRSAGEISSEYHYDLSRSSTDHLETPYTTCNAGQTVAEATEGLLTRCPRLLAGEGISRPAALVAEMPPEMAEGTCMRGGNTLIMDTTLLRDVPNSAPRIDGRPTRRSDMLWAIDARWRLGRTVRAVNLPLTHDRSFEPVNGEPTHSLIDDLVGYSFARAYEEALKGGIATASGAVDAEWVIERTRHHARERLAAYRLSFWRCRGLTRALTRLATTRPEWLRRASRPARREFFVLLKNLRERTSQSHLADVEARVRKASECGDFREFLATRDALPHTEAPSDAAITEWRDRYRERAVEGLIKARLGADPDTCLGMGTEGVVFRVSDTAVKVFDQWTAAEREANLPLLKALQEKSTEGALPDVLEIHDWLEAVAVVYRFEPSVPYDGGHGDALVRMLRDLRASGWAHRNVCPSNLRMTRQGLQIVDIGRSLVPADHHEITVMIRRAFLCWRFADRTELASLMRAAIHTEKIPELTGWRFLMEAIQAQPSKTRLDTVIREKTGTLAGNRLLDYGCGKPRETDLRSATDEVVGFDPDTTLRGRWALEAPHVTFWDKADKDAAVNNNERFDTVVCSLVLCTIDDASARRVLADLRRLSADHGRIIVAVCDPAAAQVGTTTDQCRHTTHNLDPDCPGCFEKTMQGSTTPRWEYHRPREGYRQAFARHGMSVVDEIGISEIDTLHFERVPAFRVFEIEPLEPLEASTTLLIKACALEAHTIVHQVRHLEHQLGRPRGFDEVLLLIDPHEGPFPRAYWDGDLHRLRRAGDQLVAEGRIDRIIEGPHDGQTAAAIAERWTGQPATRAHCANGQPATGILAAIEQCRGEYIFHADADVLIARPITGRDIIADAVRCFDAHPEAVTLAPAVHGDHAIAPRRKQSDGEAYRTETMAGWVARKRLLAARPLPTDLVDNRLAKPWHRMLDERLRQTGHTALRCGNPGLSFAGVDNVRKNDLDAHLLLLDRFEAGALPSNQTGHALIQGPLRDWLGPRRFEEMVVVICGRNPRVGAIDRCLRSLIDQTEQTWGAIIVDDASHSSAGDVIAEQVEGFGDRVTHVRRRRRAGRMVNLRLAIRSLVANPDSVIVLLDLDDALVDRDALAKVAEKHRTGADVTVGSMIRTDKAAHYPVTFQAPRRHRGGNVWQHLRSFRKQLFDRIESSDLSMDGNWIGIADDWAYMLPIVEMARNPVAIDDKLYLHEPSTDRPASEKRRREASIQRITERQPYNRHSRPDLKVTVLAYHRVLRDRPTSGPEALFDQHGMVVTTATLRAQMTAALRRYTPICASDFLAAVRGERSLPANALLVTFDGGYWDFATNALPMLTTMGVEPLLFARPSAVDGYPNWTPIDHFTVASTLGGDKMEAPWTGCRTKSRAPLPAYEWGALMHRSKRPNPHTADQVRRDLYLNNTELDALRGVAIGACIDEFTGQPHSGINNVNTMVPRYKAWLNDRGGHALAALSRSAISPITAAELISNGFEAVFGSSTRSVERLSNWPIERFAMSENPDFVPGAPSEEIEETAWNTAR